MVIYNYKYLRNNKWYVEDIYDGETMSYKRINNVIIVLSSIMDGSILIDIKNKNYITWLEDEEKFKNECLKYITPDEYNYFSKLKLDELDKNNKIKFNAKPIKIERLIIDYYHEINKEGGLAILA